MLTAAVRHRHCGVACRWSCRLLLLGARMLQRCHRPHGQHSLEQCAL